MDPLQIKIEKAKGELPEETRRAIDAVNWREALVKMRERGGYTVEQLGELELETELMLCGLVTPENYPKELEKRMEIPRFKAEALVKEMNDLVFKKIREELMRITDIKKMGGDVQGKFPTPTVPQTPKSIESLTQIPKEEMHTLKSAGIEIHPIAPIAPKVPDLTLPELGVGNKAEIPPKVEAPMTQQAPAHPIAGQKLSGSFQIPTTNSEYSLKNISKAGTGGQARPMDRKPGIDPYREIPE